MSPFEATSTSLIHLAVDALASAPHFTQAEKKTRTEAVVCAIMAFLPTEPVQTMLASQAVGHHFTLLDTFREINNRALTETLSMRMRMVSAVQTRMTLALVREFRVVRKEMLAAAEAERATMAAARETPAAAPAPAPATPPAPPKPETAPEQPAPPSPTAPLNAEDASLLAHLADFQAAFEATAATLEEARALDKPMANRAFGHLEKAMPPALAAAAGPDRRATPARAKTAA